MMAGGTLPIRETLPGLHTIMGASVFPIGLSMITLTGSDLLTSNMLYCSLPFLTHPQRNITPNTTARVLQMSFAGNLVGSLGVAAFATTFIFTGDPWTSFITGLALKKASITLPAAFIKGIAANWLVNVGVYMAMTARSTGGKIAAIWLPITTFVALGFEHSVANMFFIPAGILCGADISWADAFMHNIIPVACGNAVGAGVFVALLPWYTEWMKNGPAVRSRLFQGKR